MSKLLRYLLAASLAVITANVAAETKVAYVKVDRILKEAPQTAEINKKLEKEFSPRAAELDRLQKKIRDLENSDSSGKNQNLANFRLEFERKQRELNEDVNIRKNEELGTLQDRINRAVTVVSEADGYDLVIYSGIAYASKRIDITDKVLKSLGTSKAAP